MARVDRLAKSKAKQTNAMRCGTYMTIYTPAIGYLYSMFFNGVPTREGLTEVLNTIAMISGLLLAGSATIPSWISHEDLVAIDNRFAPGGVWHCVNLGRHFAEDDIYPSTFLGKRVYLSNVLLTTGLAVTLTVIMALATMGQRPNRRDKQRDFETWWLRGHGRFVTLFSLLTTVAGIIYFFIVMDKMLSFQYPDKWLENECANNRTVDWHNELVGDGDVYLRTFGLSCFYFFLVPSLVFCTWIQQIGLARVDVVANEDFDNSAQMTEALLNSEVGTLLGEAGMTMADLVDMKDDGMLLNQMLIDLGVTSIGTRARAIKAVRSSE